MTYDVHMTDSCWMVAAAAAAAAAWGEAAYGTVRGGAGHAFADLMLSSGEPLAGTKVGVSVGFCVGATVGVRVGEDVGGDELQRFQS